MAMRIVFLFLFLGLNWAAGTMAQQVETARPKSGEAVSQLLARFGRTKQRHYEVFRELNKGKFTSNGGLKLGVDYVLPPLDEGFREPLFGKKQEKYTAM